MFTLVVMLDPTIGEQEGNCYVHVSNIYHLCFLPEFVTGLLNNVGTHIDPTKLIQVYDIKSFAHHSLYLCERWKEMCVMYMQ